MERVVIESPLSGDIERNTKYARLCMLDSLKRGEAPFLSHLLYTQVLDDGKQEERKLGMEAGFEWGKMAERVVVYEDYGISGGMREGIVRAESLNIPVEYRKLNPETLSGLSNACSV